jgi:hypothetical protein
MANNDAWSAGWKTGEDARKKHDAKSKGAKPKEKKSSGGGGGNPFSILSVLKKSFHKGGKVRKTGPALLKKGEIVLTAAQAKQCAAKMSGKKSGARKRVAGKQ